MTRTLTPAMESAIVAQDVRPVLLFEGQFPSGFVRLWTGHGPIVWGGETWVGAGNLIGVSAIEESTSVVANGVSITLAGVDPQFVSLVINDAQQGLPGRIWLGLMDANGVLTIDPLQIFAGRLDVPQISDGGATCVITVSYESRLIDLNLPREWRYTHESQQVLYPGDLGLEFVAAIQDKQLTWGR